MRENGSWLKQCFSLLHLRYCCWPNRLTDHFLASCPFLDTLAPAWTVISHTSYALVSHFIYLLHCDRHHLGSMLRVARKLCSRNCIKKRDRDVILRKLMKLQKLV